MDPSTFSKLKESIKRHETYKKFPYHDTTGNLTIGYGRNLSEVGIEMDEADFLLNNNIKICESLLNSHLVFYQYLDDVRKAVLIEMTFNMGIDGILKFKTMLDFLKKHDYESASKEMLNSVWAKQVHNRAN